MLFEKGLVQSFVKYHYNSGTFLWVYVTIYCYTIEFLILCTSMHLHMLFMSHFLMKGVGRSTAELALVSPMKRAVRVLKGLCSCNLKFCSGAEQWIHQTFFFFFLKAVREKECNQKQLKYLWMLQCGWCRNVGGGFVQEFGCGGALLSIPPAAGVAQK